MLFEVPGIIRQRAVSEGGRGAVSAAVAVVSTGNGARADPHRGNWSCPRYVVRRFVAVSAAMRVYGRAGRTDEWTDVG